MKPLTFSLAALGLVASLAWSSAIAATTASVTATVTVQNISLTVTDGTVTYGTLGQNATKSTIPSDLNDKQTATNNGNVAEDFNIKGRDSANWTLGATAGSDQYIHKFCTATCGSPPTNYTALTTSYQSLGTNIAASATKSIDLFLNTPNPSTVFTQQDISITVQAVAN